MREDFFPDDEGNVHEDNINRLAAAGSPRVRRRRLRSPARGDPRADGELPRRALDLAPVPGDLFDDVSGVHEGNINALARAGSPKGATRTGTCSAPRTRSDATRWRLRARARDWPEIDPPEFRLSLQKLPAASPHHCC